MTVVSYDPDRLHLRVEGHAGSAPAGEDLVCAAVSVLVWTLLAEAEAEERFHMEAVTDEENAVIDVRCCPEGATVWACRYLFDIVMSGFALLAENYPEYIRIDKGGDDHGNE